jgi:hypothetical protein
MRKVIRGLILTDHRESMIRSMNISIKKFPIMTFTALNICKDLRNGTEERRATRNLTSCTRWEV